MNYADLLITVVIMVVVTILYLCLRKFIVWAIEHDDKWHKKRGKLGLSRETLKLTKKSALWKLTEGYLLIMFLAMLYLIKLFLDMF